MAYHLCRVGEFLAAGAANPTFRPNVFAGDAQLNPILPELVTNFSNASPPGDALLKKLSVTVYSQGTAAFRTAYAVATKGAAYTGHAPHAYDAFQVLIRGYVNDKLKTLPLKVTFPGECSGWSCSLQAELLMAGMQRTYMPADISRPGDWC
jgi:hypothetical protein